MSVRDETERVLRAWDAFERASGGEPVIDFDCRPGERAAPLDRAEVRRRLRALRADAEGEVAERIDADLAYLDALHGERPPLDAYVRATQGCVAHGWDDDRLDAVRRQAESALEKVGVAWGPAAHRELRALEEPLDVLAAPGAIRDAVAELEPLVRAATGSTADYRLSIEAVAVDAYWAYWLDGAGRDVRLRLNLPQVEFTRVGARQFALHEVLGHGLQSASLSERAGTEDVPWVRLLSVHALYQVTLEGLAQAWPLFLLPDDAPLVARVRFDHYVQLVRARAHVQVNSGMSIDDVADGMRARLPWWDGKAGRNVIRDRRDNPQLRSYLWVYPAGMEWFAHLAEANEESRNNVLKAAYQRPLTPRALRTLWPGGPDIGGTPAP
ncbi:hypothetical protein [Actinomadura rayongensis]|uniref:DUF1704 domain-containing protein n=1 Tax=Actinomadura rayongensis TaxID=1429076 RepID=A0A6I4WJ16_9ACTN|nr:hypothetical protein [Actinomadura rayongensis]